MIFPFISEPALPCNDAQLVPSLYRCIVRMIQAMSLDEILLLPLPSLMSANVLALAFDPPSPKSVGTDHDLYRLLDASELQRTLQRVVKKPSRDLHWRYLKRFSGRQAEPSPCVLP
jgi:hypothetical protein